MSPYTSEEARFWQPLPNLLCELSNELKHATPETEMELRAAYANVLQAISGAFELSLRRSLRRNRESAPSRTT